MHLSRKGISILDDRCKYPVDLYHATLHYTQSGYHWNLQKELDEVFRHQKANQRTPLVFSGVKRKVLNIFFNIDSTTKLTARRMNILTALTSKSFVGGGSEISS